MKPTPSNWTRFTSAVYYQDAARAIDWLCEAFGFEVRIKVLDPDGRVRHSELTYGDGLVMVAQESASDQRSYMSSLRSPRTTARNTGPIEATRRATRRVISGGLHSAFAAEDRTTRHRAAGVTETSSRDRNPRALRS